MKPPTDNYGDRLKRRKWQESALIAPILGVFLLLPPFISVFSINMSVFGIPLIILYIFIVWIFLILVTRYLAHKLIQDYETDLSKQADENNPDLGVNGS